jgi:hypothetical protein
LWGGGGSIEKNPTDPMNTDPLKVFFMPDWRDIELAYVKSLITGSCLLVISPEEADVILADTTISLQTRIDSIPTEALCYFTSNITQAISGTWIHVPNLQEIPNHIKALSLFRQYEAAKRQKIASS